MAVRILLLSPFTTLGFKVRIRAMFDHFLHRQVLHGTMHQCAMRLFLCCCVAICGLLFSQPASFAVVEQVRESWESRPGKFKSFHYECKIEEVEMVSIEGGDGDFFFGGASVEQQPQNPTPPMSSDLTFSMDNSRFARTTSGDKWDRDIAGIRKGSFKACFKGNDYRILVDGGLLPLGSVEDTNEPGDQLTVGTKLIPLWLSYSPISFLTDLQYKTANMTVRDHKEYHNGVECDVIEIPRKNPDWEGLVFVDAATGYLPVRFVTSYRGTPRQDVSVTYKSNKSVGSIASEWKCLFFDGNGGLARSLSGKVTTALVNEPLESSLFELEFPVGTHIVWKKGEKKEYYIQDSHKKMRPISENEFCVLPENKLTPAGNRGWLSIAITGAVVAVLLVAVVYKRREK